MKNHFDLLIFDWDGTLVDSIDWIVDCIQDAARRYDCPIPANQAAKDIIGLSIEKAILQLFPEVDSATQKLLANHYGQRFFAKPITPDDLFPGVAEMLQHFKRSGYRLAVATGKKAAGLTQAIEGTGLSELFCTTRSADQTASKPHPLMLDEIVAQLGVSKSRAVMIGDSIHDLQMAQNAGIAAIGVTCGAHDAATLQRHQPLHCFSNTTELLTLFA
jgi:phosphoglycolate phosphatase